MGRKVESVVYFGVLVGRKGERDAFAGSGFFEGDRRKREGVLFPVDDRPGGREMGEGEKEENGQSHYGQLSF